MDETTNYTPLDTEKLNPQKKKFKIPNKALIGLILFFTVGVGVLGYFLTTQSLQTGVPAKVDTTVTEIPLPSLTGEVTVKVTEEVPLSPEPTAVLEALVLTESPAEPTEEPTSIPEPTLEPTEEPAPTEEEQAIGGANDEPTATPTEIELVTDESIAETTEAEAESTNPPEVPAAGVATFSTIFAVVSIAVIFLGLIL